MDKTKEGKIKEYEVYVTGVASVYVSAESKEEALDIARENTKAEDIHWAAIDIDEAVEVEY